MSFQYWDKLYIGAYYIVYTDSSSQVFQASGARSGDIIMLIMSITITRMVCSVYVSISYVDLGDYWVRACASVQACVLFCMEISPKLKTCMIYDKD